MSSNSGWSRLQHATVDILSKLGTVEIAVYISLLRHAGSARTCFPSLARIAKVAGISERRARTAVQSLIHAGVVERTMQSAESGATIPPLYYLPEQAPQEPAEQNGPGCCDVPAGAERGAGRGGTTRHPNKKQRTITKEQTALARFAAPSVDEVATYCRERKNNVDPQHFVDHYTSNGWRVGKNVMKDWRAAVRNWERRAAEFSSKNSGTNTTAEKITFRD